jgi:glucose-6-phosphate isomerase, archaeal
LFDLKGTSGLALTADEKGKLYFGEGLSQVTADTRKKSDMLDVLYQPSADGPQELYYMYRNVHRTEDLDLINRFGLRYDVTILLPGLVGDEYIKTAGHYHPLKPGTEFTYPEVYEVLYGRAHYLLQTEPDEDGVDCILVEAQAGDKVLIPPGYGHVTINPGDSILVMSNWVGEGFASVYDQIKNLAGAAYFELKSDGEDERFEVNRRYSPAPRLATRPVVDLPDLGLVRGRPMYQAFLESPEKFTYLTHPEKYF